MGKAKNLMLIEGKNDFHVISHLLFRHEIMCVDERDTNALLKHPDHICLKQLGSIEQLLDHISIILDDGDLESLAIVVDADIDLAARWQSICDRLGILDNIEVPEQPDTQGTILRVRQSWRTLKIGIWLMPNNSLPGMLEDFIQFLVPNNDNLLTYARNCVSNIANEDRLFSERHVSKAEIHTWLAWQNQPGTPLGQAIKVRYLDATAEQGLIFVNWVQRLFLD